MNASRIDQLIGIHLDEARGGLQACSVSVLTRGQCTSRDYFIFKIDLAASTLVLRNTKPAEYARISHAYLSTVDAVTQQFGAEREQTEYQGDSVLAFFPERGNSAEEVVSAAVQAHYAVHRLRHHVSVPLRPRLLLHYATLTVAKIGPWAESHRVAIGMPIHYVAKKEDDVGGGVIWLSGSFAGQCRPALRTRFLEPAYVEKTVMEKALTQPNAPTGPTLGDLLSTGLLSKVDSGVPSMFGFGTPPQPTYIDKPVKKRVQDGYTVRLVPAYQALKLPLAVLN